MCGFKLEYMKRTIDFIVDDRFSGRTVYDILKEKFGMSGTLIKDLKKYGDGLMLNGEHIRTVDEVKSGDMLRIAIYDFASENIEPREMDLSVIYEDSDIIIVDKPSGIPTHPSFGHLYDTLANGIMAHYLKNGEEHVFRAVNRLDKDTSGLICIAKHSYAHARLCGGMHSGGIERRYMAIVTGVLRGSGTVNAPISRDSFIKRTVSPDGKRAVTHYRAVKAAEDCTLVELRLGTGRTHQIRVHMAHIGHPLLGDWLYGEENAEAFPRQALHSSYLSLAHPVTGERLCFTAGLPEDMERYINKSQ